MFKKNKEMKKIRDKNGVDVFYVCEKCGWAWVNERDAEECEKRVKWVSEEYVKGLVHCVYFNDELVGFGSVVDVLEKSGHTGDIRTELLLFKNVLGGLKNVAVSDLGKVGEFFLFWITFFNVEARGRLSDVLRFEAVKEDRLWDDGFIKLFKIMKKRGVDPVIFHSSGRLIVLMEMGEGDLVKKKRGGGDEMLN